MENDLEIWKVAKRFGKWLRYMGHGFSVLEEAILCWKWLKNLTNGLKMLEMTHICGKWLKCLRNG